MARASTSASAAAPPPARNVLAVCVAMFHERQGPILAYSHPPGAAEALAGLEWRALPSGSHALLRRDHIALLPPQPLPTQEEGQHSVVAAVVRSRATAGEEGAERRGNRVICVAAVLACEEPTPDSHYAAASPHFLKLAELAEAVSHAPSDVSRLQKWYDTNAGSETLPPVPTSARYVSALDPLSTLPSISSALGPLLPSLLKRMMMPDHRLMIFSPAGTPPSRALALHYALASLAPSPPEPRGLLALPDLTELLDEPRRAWIGVTPDAIFLERHSVYDTLLDLRPIAAGALPGALPALSFVGQQGGKLELKKVNWSTADFAAWRELEDICDVRSRVRRTVQLSEDSRDASEQRAVEQRAKSRNLQTAPGVILALLKYCLGAWLWWPLSVSDDAGAVYGWVPTAVRSDGGAVGSVVLLSDEEDDEDSADGEEEAYTEQSALLDEPTSPGAYPHTQQPRLRSRSARSRSRSHDRSHEHALGDEEEEHDPLLAAAGASTASRRRRSSHNTERHMFSPAHSPSASGVQSVMGSERHQHGDAEDEVAPSPRTSRLARALHDEWSAWSAAVLRDAEALLERKMRAGEAQISAKELRSAGLSARCAADCELLGALARERGGSVTVQRSWWTWPW